MSTVREKAPRKTGVEGQQTASTVTGKKRKKKKKPHEDEGLRAEGTAICSSLGRHPFLVCVGSVYVTVVSGTQTLVPVQL